MTKHNDQNIAVIAAHDLAGVSGGQFDGMKRRIGAAWDDATAKAQIAGVDVCDLKAEKNFFGQPINQGDCYKRVLGIR